MFCQIQPRLNVSYMFRRILETSNSNNSSDKATVRREVEYSGSLKYDVFWANSASSLIKHFLAKTVSSSLLFNPSPRVFPNCFS